MSGNNTGVAVENGDQIALQRFEGHSEEVASMGPKDKAEIKGPEKKEATGRRTELSEAKKIVIHKK